MRRACLLTVLIAAACAGDGDSRGTSSEPAWRTSGSAPAARGSNERPAGSEAATAKSFSPETLAFMQDGLKQFSRGDPGWPATRARWLAMGPRESEFLVQNMWGAVLRGQAMNAPHIVEGARHELALIGAPAVSFTSAVLAGGQIATASDGSPMQVDDLWRREAAEVLAIVGEPAVPSLLDVLSRAETKSGRRFALQALGNMGERGGAEASRALVTWSRDDDLLLQAEAVAGMRHHKDAATASALRAALSDDEELIRENAAESLAVRGDTTAVAAIRQASASARSQGRLAEAAKLERSAREIEKNAR